MDVIGWKVMKVFSVQNIQGLEKCFQINPLLNKTNLTWLLQMSVRPSHPVQIGSFDQPKRQSVPDFGSNLCGSDIRYDQMILSTFI